MPRQTLLNRIARQTALAALVLVLLNTVAMANGPIAFRQHAVQLPAERPITAMTFLVPEGWQVQGGMQRTPFELRNMFALTDLEISAPDGRSIHFYPGMSFTYSQMTQAQPLQPSGGSFFLAPPRAFSEWILYLNQLSPSPTVTDLRLVSEEPMPQVRERFLALYGQQLQEWRQIAGQGGEPFGDIHASRIVFTYNENGRAMEETFLVAWRVMGVNMANLGVTCDWAILDMRSLAGPAGTNYLNDPALVTIGHSLRFSPEYFQAMHDYYVQTFRRPPLRTVAKAQEDGESISDIIHKGWKTRNALTDTGQERMVDMIHERTPYAAPDGRTVHLSSHYQRVFSDGQDRYILTNDANWDPRLDPNFNSGQWQPLQRKPYGQ
jgi:hypothetical protein